MARGASLLIVVLVLLLGGPAPPVEAGDEWCETDPLVPVTTPGGRIVPVFVLTGAAGIEHLVAAQAAGYSYTVEPAAGGTATLVRLDVRVPSLLADEPFPTLTTASSGPLATGAILGTATGSSGTAMRVTFTLGVP
jgi:hypothetical protein